MWTCLFLSQKGEGTTFGSWTTLSRLIILFSAPHSSSSFLSPFHLNAFSRGMVTVDCSWSSRWCHNNSYGKGELGKGKQSRWRKVFYHDVSTISRPLSSHVTSDIERREWPVVRFIRAGLSLVVSNPHLKFSSLKRIFILFVGDVSFSQFLRSDRHFRRRSIHFFFD